MQRPPEDASELERLKAEVRELERRLAFVERLQNIAAPEPVAVAGGGGGDSAFALPDAVPVAGRAILGLAGAYLLRSLSEAALLPKLVVLPAAIAYAAMWLWLAARERQGAMTEIAGPVHRAAPFVYGATASLIFAPLLWEATVRFGLLPNLVTAALLVALPAFARWLGVAGSATVFASSATAIALMVETRDPLPFTVATLAIAAVEQTARKQAPRALATLAASLATLLLIWIELRPGGVPGDYRIVSRIAVALCACALPLIGVAGLMKRHGATVLEFCLLGMALAATVWGAPAGASGAILLALCAGCVWLSLPANRDTFSGVLMVEAFALPLGLVGSFLLLPTGAAVALWCALSVVAVRASVLRRSHLLEFHGVALLGSAAIVSGFAARAADAFTGVEPGPPAPGVALMVVSAALAWWVAAWSVWPRVVFACLAIVAAGTLLLEVSGAGPGLLPALQTLYLCGAALGVSFAAARTNFGELSWIGHGLLVAGGLKLLLVDFRESRPHMLAISLVCYGTALILVSRLKRRGAEAEPRL